MVTAEQRPPLLSSGVATFATNLAAAGLSLLNVLITARALGADGRGQIAFLTTVAYLTSQVASLGIQQAVVNLAGREPSLTPALFGTSVALSALLGGGAAAAVALAVLIVPAVGGSASTALLAFALAAVPMLVLQICLQFLVIAHYGFRAMNSAWLLVPVVTCAVNGALALAGELTVGAAVGAWIGGQVLATILLWRAVTARHGGPRRADPQLGRRMLSFGVQAHGGRVMLLGNYRLDQWILGGVAGPRELGIYSVAVAWAEALFFLPTALATVQRPDLVRADARAAAERAARVLRVTLLVTIPLALALIALAPVLCVGIFGEEFRSSVGQVRILACGAFGIVALKLLGGALTAQGRPLSETAAIAVAFVAIVGLDVALIPAYEGTGAAIASTIAYTLGGVAVAVLFIRALPVQATALVPRPGDGPEAMRAAARLAGELRRGAAR
jgi:O-antigen/teichoic acid export membrane protein